MLQYNGAEAFFKNLESFDFSADVFEKLDAVRLVLFGMGEEVMPELVTNEIRTQKIDQHGRWCKVVKKKYDEAYASNFIKV